jgi:superfamily II DNA or RNA helicase
MSYWLKYLDPIESKMSRDLADIVDPYISYNSVYYKQGAFHKIRKDYIKSTIIGRNKKEGDLFYSGLIPRILKICEEKKIDLQYHVPPKMIEPSNEEMPEGITLRPFQKELIDKAIEKERGVLKAPTGTGKTVLGLALIRSIRDLGGVLWLCHTKDLLDQTAEEALKFFRKEDIGKLGDGYEETDRFLTVATRQTFKKYIDKLCLAYDMVILDEVHHLSSFSGEYADILRKIFAPIRIGLTATLPESKESLMAIESMIGPLIGEVTINEGREQGFMAHPIIKLVKIPRREDVAQLKRYTDVYEKGIVRRLDRNKEIVRIIGECQKSDKSVLVIVVKIDHGKLLMNLCQREGLSAEFVYGNTETESRDLAKKALNSKGLKCVICTAVWKEGVNIPELNVVINAAGGKSELVTLQSIGRGLRRTEDKDELLIYDFFDPSHRYLIEHFGHRISLYMDNGWL